MRPVQPSVVAVQRHVKLSAVPSSGIVNSMIRITGIGDRDRPEWLIRINGMRNERRHLANSLEFLGKSGAGEGIRTLDPNLGKVASPGVISPFSHSPKNTIVEDQTVTPTPC